ncbi:hypothetical protein AWZ03_010567 [Drosophila navojoa]|uniref:LITAF domain-containing protein n=1 Tax=Drosophila navojoa TaxID=7232 RepID=A0A484B5E6_DRONA|nr:lipopolysaccharide-induced tumor necrosis factor-alpha factor homolog [Drosophila navojoa]TDG43045.1 hypothetical protein AWZ03_010567 [Drosophila navojoa]
MSAIGRVSTRMVCPNCHLDMMTRIVSKATARTHMIALLMCLTFLWPCALCVYCTDFSRNVDHYCSFCNAFIGTYDH